MGTSQKIEHRGHVVGFRQEITEAASRGPNELFRWFNNAQDMESSFIQGEWDFEYHIAQPLRPYLTSPHDKVILEIGHGGGRMLAAASRCFREAVGIDVHDHNATVERVLEERGVRNARLYRTEGANVPIPDAEVDCVYSFIVLQHVEKYQVFRRYLEETFRVLKPDGLAVLYFGRKYRFSFNRSSRVCYWIDRPLECLQMKSGYEEIPARVNETNLRVSLAHARRLALSIGYEVLGGLVSRRRGPDGEWCYGGQSGVLLRKPVDPLRGL
jgi:ubiquinone/menaquinone biosynthesis C-methylase UbiE